MKQYNLINNVMGWVAFLIAAITYISTTEDSASFWDCGEFIATADKLLVGHPPGAPLFMIIARFFAILAPSAEMVAQFVNVMSALASALTILFLFWTVTHLARKLVIDGTELDANGEPETWRTWAVMAAGMVGALAYTFSDTFWFSAVEGEVYGMSSLFTALVFWCILKWENVADEPGANRWIVLIAYLMGLSIGVHLLNLLCIPAIAMVYYFRKYQPTAKGLITALVISCVVLAAILYGIIPGLVRVAGWFDLFFVNNLGCPLNTGAIIWMLLLFAGTIYGIYWTWEKGKALANTIITAFAVIVVGYLSFAMVVIRSASDPTMDQNSPDNVFALIDYLNREQYGDRPLFYGQTFASPIDRRASAELEGAPIYVVKDGKYECVDHKPIYKYQASVVFPRMYSNQPSHVQQYKSWTGFVGRNAQIVDEEGRTSTVRIPTLGENLTFFFKYQVNFMYWRYFLWNFSGRQNDIQSHGELTHGNWITGISAIDNLMLGDQDLLPDNLKNNKGHNEYYMLPLILGLLGMLWQVWKGKNGKQGFGIVMCLFFMTGLAIVLYLNQTPLQPRERDYAYAGSFYAFAIWIGLGVLQLIEWLNEIKKLPRMASVVIAGVLSLVFVPGLMAQQNWDDHDRSGCTIARDIAYNYLNSCEPNAVLFTNGDNDTFPLWYAQEVEGCRTDVRVCNLSYLQTEWYCDQMLRKAYNGAPVPISFTKEQYTHDRDVIYLIDHQKGYIDLGQALAFVKSENPKTKSLPGYAERICFIPGHNFAFKVNKQAVMENGVVPESSANNILDTMRFSIGGNYILKNQLMVLDMLNTAQWSRPIYYAVTVGRENYCGLENYFQLEGLAYRIAPLYGAPDGMGQSGTVNTERMYDIVMNKFRWGFYNKEGLYLDENKTRMGSNLRNNLTRLSTALLDEAKNSPDSVQKKQRAVEVLDKIMYELPPSIIPHNFFSIDLANGYYRAAVICPDEKSEECLAKGDKIIHDFAKENLQELNFYLNLNQNRMLSNYDGIQRCLALHYEIMRTCDRNNRTDIMDEIDEMYEPMALIVKHLTGE